MNTVIPDNPDVFGTILQRTLQGSRYVQRMLDSDPELVQWLPDVYAQPCHAAELSAWLAALPTGNEAELSQALRRLRKRAMVKLITRDLGGMANLDEVMACMTALAELCLQRAYAFVMKDLTARYGEPAGERSGAPQPLLITGMGKLGGRELNVSSDIDLIFVYPEEGQTVGRQAISNHEFFSKLGRRLIALIGDLTEEGYVFRVDMRLRPYGDSGSLVMSFTALEEYLVTQGREWERYAWIKARIVSGGDDTELMRLVQPFIFRKYLDFGAFESMRNLHAQIRQEVQRRDRLNNIKLGPGGIREIEFIAQVFQLIRGGQDSALRIRPTLQVLQQLGKNNQLTADTVAELSAAYIFLRNLEHRLQYLDDQQTQDLPENPDDQQRIATGMGYTHYAALLEQLNRHRAGVSAQFAQIFSTGQNDRAANGNAESALWGDNLNVDELRSGLEKLHYRDSAKVAGQLLNIRDSARYRQLPENSRQRLDKLIPQFIELCALPENREHALTRVLKLLESISRRAAYLAFLAEYPQVLQRLVQIASASEWACDYLIQHPVLLDELLDAREIYRAPDWAALDQSLQHQLAACQADTEREMDVLRQFQHSQVFHLLAMDLQGLLPLEKLSDHLSDLADLILKHVLQECWRDARKKHQPQPAFAIIAYGKLGGRELGYAADLDVIFLYDDGHPDAAEIYAKLAQRINNQLSSYTSAGRLYETDLRLRPNGASGLLVSSIAAFGEYQRLHAWVWEHQALTRARFCAGDADVGKQFEHIRTEVLCQPRDLNNLRDEIVIMRDKMLDAHPNNSGLFDLKHDRGGMVDIEFIVQFLVLAHAHAHHELTANSGNLALLALAGKLGLIETGLAGQVSQIYRRQRVLQHMKRLDNQLPRIAATDIDVSTVITLWRALLEKTA